MKEYLDELQYINDVQQTRRDWVKVNKFIVKLQSDNQPLYWDILYDGLKGKSNPHELYCMRYAELNNRNWRNDQNTRNEIRKMFSGYFPHEYSYYFPQKLVTVAEDGSFTLNIEAVEEQCKQENTYTLNDKQEQAVNDLLRCIDKVGIAPERIGECFVSVNGKFVPQWKVISKSIKI